MQEIGPITTATSQAEGRLKVGAGCQHNKKKCLKCAIKKSKKDGKGGISIPAPSYGKQSTRMTSKSHRASVQSGGLSLKGYKKLKSLAGAAPKMKFTKTLKSIKLKSLKAKTLKL